MIKALVGGKKRPVVSLWPKGTVELPFRYLVNHAPFDDDMRRQALVDEFAALPGFDLPDKALNKGPQQPLSRLADEETRTKFLAILDEIAATQ